MSEEPMQVNKDEFLRILAEKLTVWDDTQIALYVRECAPYVKIDRGPVKTIEQAFTDGDFIYDREEIKKYSNSPEERSKIASIFLFGKESPYWGMEVDEFLEWLSHDKNRRDDDIARFVRVNLPGVMDRIERESRKPE